jgi:hypothetical protein
MKANQFTARFPTEKGTLYYRTRGKSQTIPVDGNGLPEPARRKSPAERIHPQPPIAATRPEQGAFVCGATHRENGLQLVKKPSKSPNTICRAKEPLLLAVLHLRHREWWVVVDLEALPVTLAPHLRVASPGASTSTICGNDTAIIPRIALLLKLSFLALRRASEIEMGRIDVQEDPRRACSDVGRVAGVLRR